MFNKAIIATRVAKLVLLYFSNFVKIAHFGKNPVSGGKPLGILFHDSEIELIGVNENVTSCEDNVDS